MAKANVKKLSLVNFAPAGKSQGQAQEDHFTQLDHAVCAIQTKRSTPLTFEALYRLVETICSTGQSATLYARLRHRCSEHLQQVRAQLLRSIGIDGLEFLGKLCELWTQHCEQMILIRSIFVFLDRSYALKNSSVECIWTMGLHLFLENVLSEKQIQAKTVNAMLALIDAEREGQLISRPQLRTASMMLRDVGVYAAVFEAPFLARTTEFYAAESRRLVTELEAGAYIRHAERRLQEEQSRLDECLCLSTLRALVSILDEQLIRQHLATVFDKGLPAMLAGDRDADLALLYSLCAHVDGLELLRDAFRACIKSAGAEIVTNPARDKTMVDDLLAYKQRMDAVVAGPFAKTELLSNALKDGFESFVNQRHNKPAELIAKYIDTMLRTGYKKMTEEQLETLLDRVLVVFRFVNGKDVFEAFYKNCLAKRLLLQLSSSDDLERAVIFKLKAECGSMFTAKMEGMIKDTSLSREITQAYRQYCSTRQVSKIDFSINVLTLSNWPTYPPATITLPAELAAIQRAFEAFYTAQHSNRKLSWQPALGFCVLKTSFTSGSKDLHVSLYQATVLLLFAETDSLTYTAIKEATLIDEKSLKLTLLSLACGQARVLTKTPKGAEIGAGDTFAFNAGFKSPHKRVKINQIQQKETEEENEATSDKIFQDRLYAVDAALVRIMKTRKTLKHNSLIAEVMAQLKFPCKTADLKKRIESLIERDYLERDAQDAQSYKYVA